MLTKAFDQNYCKNSNTVIIYIYIKKTVFSFNIF